ncbi:MAG: DUF2497 domain-containing protein [Polymorphobacter sp.]|uniref:DUF2497 domain-containing protein n=1 Tax=Polymorphobacter sp. TaxID=1909290 RepID=UPI003A8B47B5
MTDLPPTIDAILESIRARVTGEVAAAPPAAEGPPPLPVIPSPATDPGKVTLSEGSMTLDALVQKMLEPMLKAWLDQRLPEIVERVAREEIRRIAGQ